MSSCKQVLVGFPIINNKGIELLNVSETPKYMRYMDYLMGQVFKQHAVSEGYVVNDLKDPVKFKKVYDNTANQLIYDLKDRIAKTIIDSKSDIAKKLVVLHKNFDVFAEYHSKYHGLINIDLSLQEEDDAEEAISETEDTNEGDKPEEFDKTGNSDEVYELASNNLKILMRLLAKTRQNEDGNIVEILDEDGLPTSADFSSLWNNLALKLAGKIDESDFLSTFNSPNLIKVLPEVEQLIQLLNINKENTNKQTLQYTEFYRVFSRPIIKLWMSKRTESNSIVFFEQLKGNRNKIVSQFVSNFITETIPDYLKQYTTKDGDFNELRVMSLPPKGNFDRTKVFNPNIKNYTAFQNELDLLELLGIKFTNLHLASSFEERKEFIKLFVDVRDVLHDNIQNRLNTDQKLINPVLQLQEKYDSIDSNYNIIQNAINLESKYSAVSPTFMTKTPEGNPASDISSHNAISVAIYHLNKANTLKELYLTPSFIKAEYSPLFTKTKIIQHLFDANGNKRPNSSVNVINYSGFEIEKGVTKMTRNLLTTEKMVFDFSNMLQYGVTDTLRLETANSFYAIQLIGEDNKIKPHYSKNAFKDNFNFSSFRNDMLGYLEAELERISLYNKAKNKANSPYKNLPQFGEFSIFSEIIKNELQTSLKAKGITEENKQKFFQAIEQHFNNQLLEFNSLLNKGNVKDEYLISKELNDVERNDLIRSFLANSFVTNVDFSIFSGESLFYPKANMPKRLKGLGSTGNLTASLNVLNNYLYNNSTEQLWKQKYGLSEALDIKQRDNSKNYQTSTVDDVISEDNAYTNSKFQENVRKSISIRDGIPVVEISLEDVLADLEPGNKIETTDGQSLTTLDFHRELSFRHSFNTPELEIAYEYEGLMFRKLNNKPFDENKLQELSKLIFSENANKYAIPTLKFTYWGNVENKDVKVDAKKFDKTSIAPIIPSHAHIKDGRGNYVHKKLHDLNLKMLKTQMAYVGFKSSTKTYVRKIVTLQDVGNDSDLQSTTLLKEQKKTTVTQKISSTPLTQTNKLLLANLFNNKIAVTPRVQDEYNKYFTTLTDIQKEQNKILFDTLGFTVDENSNVTSFSVEKIASALQKEISRQKLPSTIAKALETIENEDGSLRFKYSPEQSGTYSIINDYISGVIDKTLRRYKTNSADYVLQTSALLGIKLNYFGFNESATIPMDCVITLSKPFIPLLNKLDPRTNAAIGNIERLNELLLDENWRQANKKELTVAFSRPPVSGQNSMGFALVRQFMSPTAANTLILPEEFIAQSGTDFDIDVERVIIPQLTDRGDYISKESMAQIKKDIKSLENEYPELLQYVIDQEDIEENLNNFISAILQSTSKELDANIAVIDNDNATNLDYRSYFYLKNLKNLSATNRLLESYIGILSLPENFADLVIPNTSKDINALAGKNAAELGRSEFISEDGTVKLPSLGQVYEYNKQLDITRKFFESKAYLGGYAVDNVAQPIAAQNGLTLNQTYNINNFKENGVFKSSFNFINPLIFSLEQRDKIISDGQVSLANRFDFNNKPIQHFSSQKITATVDGPNNPSHSELGIGWESLSVSNFLMNMRQVPEVVYDFVNNPVITKYLDLKKEHRNKTKALGELLKTLDIGKPIKVKEYVLYTEYKGSKLGLALKSNPAQPGSAKIYYEIEKDAVEAFTKFEVFNALKQIDFENKDKYISPERLKELKDNTKYKEASTEDKEDYAAILVNFAQFETHASNLKTFRNFFNFDTAKISSSFEVDNKRRIKNKVLENNTNKVGMITKESFDSYEKNSLISPFINLNTQDAIYKQVFTVTNDPVVKQNLSHLYNEYVEGFPVSNRLKLIMPTILVNDFLKAVIDNFGMYKGEKLNDYGRNLISKKQNTEGQTIKDRFVIFKQKPFYEQVERQFPILKQFKPDVSPLQITEGAFKTLTAKGYLQTKAHNIKFVRNSSDIVAETESYIAQLEKLISPDLKIGELKQSSLDQIQNFVKDLLIVGYYQSGLSKSYQSFSDIIPLEFKLSFIPEAINKFQALSPSQKQLFMGNPITKNGKTQYDKDGIGFAPNFYANNKKYFPNKSDAKKSEAALRAKGYNFDLNSLQIADQTNPVSSKLFKVENPVKGVQLVRNSMNNEEIQFVLDYIKPIIEQTGFFANAATSNSKHANLMFSMGYSAWVPKRIINGREEEVQPVWHITASDYYTNNKKIDGWKKEGISEADIAKKLYEQGTNVYVYTLKNPDGSDIVPMPKEIFDILDRNFDIKSQGIYDSIIGNIYEENSKNGGWRTMIQYHEDTSEPYNNKTPIRVLVLGNEYEIKLDKNEANSDVPSWKGLERPSEPIKVKQGDVYEIGKIDEKGNAQGRYTGHMPYVNDKTGEDNNLSVKLPILDLKETYQIDYNGNKIKIPARKLVDYAVSLTFRSVKPTSLTLEQLTSISTKDLSQTNSVVSSQENNNVNTLQSSVEFTNHSGGAIGADSEFDKIGRELGFNNHNHYWANSKTPLGNKELTNSELVEGVIHAKAAAKELGRPWIDKYANLLGRNWFQVKNSTQVIAIAPIVYPGETNSKGYTINAKRATVDGGTGYAVEMGIANNKEVNVFDTKTNQWYKWNGNTFEISGIPILQKDFAGIGSRQDNGKMTPESIQAIRNVYEKALTNKTKIDVKETSKGVYNIYAGSGENAVLSNFAERSFIVDGTNTDLDGLKFNNVEGAYQAYKLYYTPNEFKGNEQLLKQLQTTTGSQAKSLGRTIKNLDIKEWDKDSSSNMKGLLQDSFKQNSNALQNLFATGNATLTHTQDKSKWGTEFPKLLMEVRDELKNKETSKPNIEVVERYTNKDLKANPNKIYVFGDNTDRQGTGGQAQIRNNANAFGIATKIHPTNNANAFMSDKDLEANKSVIDGDIQKILDQNKPVVLAKDGYGTGLAKLKEKAPQTYQYLKEQLLEKFGFNNDTGELNNTQNTNEELPWKSVEQMAKEGFVGTVSDENGDTWVLAKDLPPTKICN